MRLFVLVLIGCGEEQITHSDNDSSMDSPCTDTWIEDGDITWQAGQCLGWSPQSDEEMTWYEAISPSEAIEGQCGLHCDETDPGYCEDLDGLGGWTGWRLPTNDELDTAAKSNPTVTPLEGYMWSIDTDPIADENAWTVDFSQPGWSILLGKTQGAFVRCVIDGT